MTFPYGETVTRHRASTTTDDYQNTVEDWSSTSDASLEGCGVALAGTFDLGAQDRAAIEADFQVFMDPNTDVLPTDRLTIRTKVCDVVGQPFEWVNPLTGWSPGLVVLARVREG